MIRTALLLALVVVAPALGQEPDRRGEVAIDAPAYRGVNASAPIPPSQHLRNEGGSDRAGLCVPTSVTINGAYQGVADLDQGKASRLWSTAKSRPGGYGPVKLAALVGETVPSTEIYESVVGTDPSILDKWSREGLPIGATMNTGALYGYKAIHHMISLVHYRTGGWACVVDNNDPGKFHWMPASEFDRRWPDGGTGWAFVWKKLPGGSAPIILIGAFVATMVVFVAVVVPLPR